MKSAPWVCALAGVLYGVLVAPVASSQSSVRFGSDALRHGAAVTGITYTDGRFVSVGLDGVLRSWDARSGAPGETSSARGPVLAASMSADGRVVALSLRDLPAELRSPERTAALPDSEGLEGIVTSPDGARVACWTYREPRVSVHDVATVLGAGGPAASYEIDAQDLDTVAFSPDGARVVLVGRTLRSRRDMEAVVQVRALADGGELGRFVVPGALVSVALADDAGILLGTLDGRVLAREWDGAETRPDLATGGGVTALHRHGDILHVGTATGEVLAFDLVADDDAPLWRDARHRGEVRGMATDGEVLASAAEDQIVQLRALDGEPLDPVERHTVGLASADAAGDWVATGDWSGRVGLWDRASGAWRQWIDAHAGRVNGLALLDDGARLLTAGHDGRVTLWDTASGERLAEVSLGAAALDLDVASAGDAFEVVVGRGDGQATWITIDRETATPRVQRSFGQGGGFVFAVAFDPSGRRVAVGTSRVTLYALDAEDGEAALWEHSTGSPVADLAFSWDGRLLATANADRSVHVLEVQDASPRAVFPGSMGRVGAVAFAPDGTRVASAATAETGVRVWSLQSGGQVDTIERHLNPITTLRWGADGLLTASLDGTAVLALD